MDNFKAVYKILTALEKAMDLPEFDISQVGPESPGDHGADPIRHTEKHDAIAWCFFHTQGWEQNGRMLQVLQPEPHRGQGGRLHGSGPVPHFPLTHPRFTRIFSSHFRQNRL